jgi:glycosyltransferase involved in cell wall biosynthesis
MPDVSRDQGRPGLAAGRPQLTVAIPTCNGARHLADALRGVLAQEGVAFELVVSDDRSDDETLAIVRELAGDRARVAVNGERLGLAGNWDRCVALARAPWVAVFHQDDVMYPGHLAAHASAIEADPRLGLVWSAADLIDDAGAPVAGMAIERGELGPPDRTFAPGALLPELAVGNPMRCSAVTIRVAAHAEAGGFDPSYRYALDWDFWLRVARRWPVAWLSRPTVAVRWHPASETHRFKAGTTDLDEQVRLLDALYNREAAAWPDARRLRRDADRRLARAFLNRAHEALRGGDPALARRCLKRSVTLSPRILGTIARDPRLCAQMTALAVAPGMSARWFSRRLRS